MNKFRLALLFVTIAGLLSGCQSVPANRPAVTSVPSSTALIITVEADDMTEEEYKARRQELIAYLIERGYILSEADLVAESTDADRLIRVTFGAEGGFKLSVFNLDSQAVAEPTVVASYSYSIPASYYGDYYYYGFAPIPFYGYSSWPTYYYPIYPSYPVCAPIVKPIAPYCSPWASPKRHYDDFCYKPTQYVNCDYRSKPHNQWAGRQFWANSGDNHYRNRRNGGDNRPYASTAAVTDRTPGSPSVNRTRANQSNPNNARTAGRGNRPQNQSPRVITADNPPANANAAASTSPAPTTVRNASMPPTARTVGRDNRNNQPAARPPGNGQRPAYPNTARTSPPATTPAATPPTSDVRTAGTDNRPRQAYPRANPTDNRPRQVYPRANPTDNRTVDSRVASSDNRPRNYSPAPNSGNTPRPANTANNVRPANGANHPRPANVANNARPTNGTTVARPSSAPSSSGRHQAAPQNNPAPRSNPAPQSQPSRSNSNQQTASSQRESSTARQSNEH